MELSVILPLTCLAVPFWAAHLWLSFLNKNHSVTPHISTNA